MVNDNKPNDDGLHRTKRQVQQNFGRQALAYNANCLLADEENLNTIIRMAGITGRERVLDLATGTGFLAAALSKAAKEVLATDITVEMLQQTRPKTDSNTAFALADVEKLPFSDNSFDVVTCRVALHHFTKPETAILEMHRVCRTDGRVVIMDVISSEDGVKGAYHNTMERLRDSSHVKQYSRSELEGMMKASGLKIDEVNLWNYTWLMDEWLSIANPNSGASTEIRRMMIDSMDGDKSGLKVELEDDEIYFSYTTVIISARLES